MKNHTSNEASSSEYLRERGIPFVEKNDGAHLIVEGRECFIDFWPGTGKWNSRCGKKGFGVRNLVAFIGEPSNPQIKPSCEVASLELLEALKLARAELAGLPRSLGYGFTHLPKIDAVVAKYSESGA